MPCKEPEERLFLLHVPQTRIVHSATLNIDKTFFILAENLQHTFFPVQVKNLEQVSERNMREPAFNLLVPDNGLAPPFAGCNKSESISLRKPLISTASETINIKGTSVVWGLFLSI